MAGRIYLIGADGTLMAMNEAPYEAELLLQRLLADYPDLLAGDQIQPRAPRRWLLVSREVGVPDSEAERARWSVDHLFIDQDGIPTLVEVKRSSNTQVRREVVGQMLDYAANGTLYWSLEQIRSSFVARCDSEGLESSEVIESFLGNDSGMEEEAFWQTVKTNLQAGRVRLVFVADAIPPELRRIIEFLNEQMDPAEVMGLEVPQFVGEGQQALVPRVVGVTAESERRKAVATSRRRRWDEDSYFEEMASRVSPSEVHAARRLYEWARHRGLEISWGSGTQNGSFSLKAPVGGELASMFTVYTDYNIGFSFGAMRLAPFDDIAGRRRLAERLAAASPKLAFDDSKLDKYPFGGRGAIVRDAEIESFFAAWDWYISELSRHAT